MAKEGEGFTGKASPPEQEQRKKARKAEDIRPGDRVTVPMIVVEATLHIDSVVLTLTDPNGNLLVVRHTPGDGIEEVERPENPTVPFQGRNFAGGSGGRPSMGPVLPVPTGTPTPTSPTPTVPTPGKPGVIDTDVNTDVVVGRG